jgi:hypothetical protein
MPILRIVVGTVIVFNKEGIGNLPAEFLNIIHQRRRCSEFSYWTLIFVYQHYNLTGWFVCWFPVRPPSCQVVVD